MIAKDFKKPAHATKRDCKVISDIEYFDVTVKDRKIVLKPGPRLLL